MPEKSWRLRPYLGYDWIAGVALPRAWRLGVGGPSLLVHLPEPPPGGKIFSTTSSASALGTVKSTETVFAKCC